METCWYAVEMKRQANYKGLKTTKWVIDSGATSHMTNMEELFSTPWNDPGAQVISANGTAIPTVSCEDLHFSTKDRNEGNCNINLKGTLLVPDLIGSIISISKLTKEGHKVDFFEDKCEISYKGEVRFTARLEKGHFVIYTESTTKVIKSTKSKEQDSNKSNEALIIKENKTNVHQEQHEDIPEGIEEPEDWPNVLELPTNEQKLWINSMKNEMQILEEAKIWEQVKTPLGAKLLPCRWTYKIKTDDKSRPVGLRSRLVVKGCGQRPGFDYSETYAPVVRHVTIRALLTLAGKFNLETKHCDVKSAFLYGDLKEDLFIKSLPGPWEPIPEKHCLKLNKAMYGLKQAAYEWNCKINSTLTKFGLEKSTADECLYLRFESNFKLYVIIHVDDILFFSNNKQWMKDLYKHLSYEYQLKDLGPVTNYLGIHIYKDPVNNCYYINQKTKINKLVKDLNMTDCTDKPIPMSPDFIRCKIEEESPLLSSNVKYQQVVGLLMYLSLVSRPDISISVNILGRAVSKPTQFHWKALKDIVKYLKFTVDYNLYLDCQGSTLLELYCDADWGGDMKDRHSTSGGVFLMGKSVVGWTTKKQNCISLSTAEAEYVSLANTVREATWLITLMSDLRNDYTLPVRVHCDSQSCISLAYGDGCHSRTKHIDIRNHYSREQIRKGVINLVFCPTAQMLADIFTKPMGRTIFEGFRDRLQLKNI